MGTPLGEVAITLNQSDPFARAEGEPLVVAVGTPFPSDEGLPPLLQPHVPNVEVYFTPYSESRDARAARGMNGGVLPAGIPTPVIEAETAAIWQRVHIFVSIDLPNNAAEVLPNLRWFQTASAGIDHVDKAQLASMGARLSSANGIASASIAEFVMARLLEVWKSLRRIEQSQREQRWVETFGTEVGGRTLLIAGLGSVGREIARRARAFDLRVIATRGSTEPGDTDPAVDELHPAVAMADLLPQADAVVCALPASSTTTDLFDEAMFRRMKPDAIFCNVGRGTLVVEPDLIKVLHDGHLRAAVLDVMRTEPIPEGDQLWTAPRTYLSPHSAVSLDRYMDNAWSLLADNLGRFIAGEALVNEVAL